MSLPIYVIGDSHASFFSGNEQMQEGWPARSEDKLPWFRSYRLEAVTAWGSPSGFMDAALATVPAGATVMLSHGEIDCRIHILRQSKKQDRPIGAIIEDVTARYLRTIENVAGRGYRVLVWGPPPSTPVPPREGDYPIVDCCQTRNHVTRLFNASLEARCRPVGVPVIWLHDELLAPDGSTDWRFVPDSLHLGQAAMPLALRKLRAVVPELPAVG
jgi:hypothetical protein